MKPIALYVLFFLSGVAGLGYEMLWTRMLSVSLGHEFLSVLSVVGAFFAGLALGAWLLDRPVSRSAFPGRWFAVLEAIIGLWALALVQILPPLSGFIAGLIGVEPTLLRHWGIAFLYPFVILLPATAAMGGTLPAMDRLFEHLQNDRRAVAGLYSVNTFGAVAGVLLVTFTLMPAFGMRTTSLLLALINFVGAAGVAVLSRGAQPKVRPLQPPHAPGMARWHLYAILFVTGWLGIGFEVVMVRALSQILENTVFSFAVLLTVFLFGTAAGAAVYQRIKGCIPSTRGLGFMLTTTAACCLLSIYLLHHVAPLFDLLGIFFGRGFTGAVAAEIAITLLIFLLPAAAMGATFSHLAQSLRHPGGGVGRALCLNTLGGALAPLFFGVYLLPKIGLQSVLLAIAVSYLLCMPRFHRPTVTAALGLTAVALWLGGPAGPNRLTSLAEGDTLVSHREGVMASVSVVKDSRTHLHLKVNNRFQMGGTASVFSDQRQALLPLLLHPEPRQALFLGLGSGVTFSAAAVFPQLEAVGVELIPEVVDALGYFEKATGDFNQHHNLKIIIADARRFVAAADRTFDVVVADLFHPARDGAGSLYTVEHFGAVRGVLEENGLFCQWLPLYQLDLETFKVIARTFLEVFPEGQAFLAHYSIDQPIIALIGARKPLRFPERWYEKRVQGRAFTRHIAGFGYDSIYSLLGGFLAGGEALGRFVGAGPLNTDDHPVVLFQAPRFVYGAPGPPQERLAALVAALSPPDPESILAEVITEEDYLARPRLSAYWTARDSFLELGMNVARTDDVARLHAAASAPLLSVVRQSTDFSAAYYPLISIAYDLYPHDRDAAYRLLRDLERANPLKPEAGILRQRLFSPSATP
jgi:spermidine synthase